MFSVFIAYGGTKAKKVAENLGKFLFQNRIHNFVASAEIKLWLIPGQPNYSEDILEELQKSDIIVIVSTKKSCYSKKLQTEVRKILQSKPRPIIVLKHWNSRFPFANKIRKNNWVTPIDFYWNKLNDAFPHVAINILLNAEFEAQLRADTEAQLRAQIEAQKNEQLIESTRQR